jgi:hypothetical protein
MITVMVLTTRVVRVRPEDTTGDWLETWAGSASLVLTLVPFAGIALLWFTGVVRDWLGEREDRFFSTLFFGSGILLVGLFYLWGAVFGAILRTRVVAAVELTDDDLYVFGFALMNEIVGNYVLRVAGIYMTAISTLWTRTGVMPRWLTLFTYVLALGFLLAAQRIREARFIFPAWVFVVSVYILILNYRRIQPRWPGWTRRG